MSICYDRRGNENLDQFPCDPDQTSNIKTCCELGDSCASNGLCVTGKEGTLTPYFIHGCTVDDWSDPTCPTQCCNATGNGIKSCGNSLFCCFGRQDCDCDDEEQVFIMEPIRIVATIPADPPQLATTTSREDSINTSMASTAASSTTTTSPAAQTTAGLARDPPSEEPNHSLTIGLGVGLGIGIPMAVIVVAVVWFFWRQRSKSQLTANLSQDSSSQGGTASLYEKYGRGILTWTELDSHARPTELAVPGDGLRARYEMP